jgi:hypothetical protein
VEFTSSGMGFSSLSIDVKMEKRKFLDCNMRGKVRECKTINVQQKIPTLNVRLLALNTTVGRFDS